MTLGDVVPDHGAIQGLKPEHGPLRSAVLCFSNNVRHSIYAERAAVKPWVLTICNGKQSPKEYVGRITHLARLSNVYGPTALLAAPEARDRQAQWPKAIALHDVWEVQNSPRLVEELGVARSMFSGQYSKICGSPEDVRSVWRGLARYPVVPAKVERDPALFDPGVPGPPRAPTAEEGRARYHHARRFERSDALSRDARRANRARNAGRLVCEACGFNDLTDALFDVHHLMPLHSGRRTTTPADLVLLCAICHRWAHHKPGPVHEPLPVAALRAIRWPA